MIVRLQLQQVLDGTSFRILGALRNLVHLQPIATSLLSEEQYVVVVSGGIYVFYEILVACRATLGSYTASMLGTEFGEGSPLDISEMRYRDNHGIIGEEIFGIEVPAKRIDSRASFIAVTVSNICQFSLDDLTEHLLAVQDLLITCYGGQQALILLLQFVHLQAGELTQTHLDDFVGLCHIEFKAVAQTLLGFLGRGGTADDVYYLVNIVAGYYQSFGQMRLLFGLCQIMTRATQHDLTAMFNERLKNFLKAQRLGTPVDQCNVIHAERRL